MTVRELLKTATADIWITVEENPNDEENPDIIVQSHYVYNGDLLSDKVLDSKIHLMMAPKEDVIYVSLMWEY